MELKIDYVLPPGIAAAQSEALRMEKVGFDGLWALETQSDPLQDLAAPALQTERIELGTNVAIAFARSPFVTALDAWRLQQASRGRFILGLGSEVKGHIERRFGLTWESPGPKLREYVQAVKAIWRAFQKEERLNFRGKFYTHTLLIPYFDPGPINFPAPPIYVAAVNPYNAETAGLAGDGLMIHPMHSLKYLNEVVFPALQRGLDRSGRRRSEVSVVVAAFAIVGDEEERAAAEKYTRSLIAFQGAVRTYARFFDLHGYGDLPQKLHELMTEGDLKGMNNLINDDIMDEVAVRGRTDEEVAVKLRDKYLDVADRITIFNLPTTPWAKDEARLRRVIPALQGKPEVVGATA